MNNGINFKLKHPTSPAEIIECHDDYLSWQLKTLFWHGPKWPFRASCEAEIRNCRQTIATQRRILELQP